MVKTLKNSENTNFKYFLKAMIIMQ